MAMNLKTGGIMPETIEVQTLRVNIDQTQCAMGKGLKGLLCRRVVRWCRLMCILLTLGVGYVLFNTKIPNVHFTAATYVMVAVVGVAFARISALLFTLVSRVLRRHLLTCRPMRQDEVQILINNPKSLRAQAIASQFSISTFIANSDNHSLLNEASILAAIQTAQQNKSRLIFRSAWVIIGSFMLSYAVMTRLLSYYTFTQGNRFQLRSRRILAVDRVYRSHTSHHHTYRTFDYYDLSFARGRLYPKHLLNNTVSVSDDDSLSLFHVQDPVTVTLKRTQFAVAVDSIYTAPS